MVFPFKAGKSLPEKAEDEKAKITMKQMRLQSERLDREIANERRRKAQELRRLTA